MRRLTRRWCTLAVFPFAVACGERSGPDTTVVIAAGGDGDIVFPLLWQQGQARVYTELMFDKLADIGAAQNAVGDAGYEPRLARSWRWSDDSLSVTFDLDPRARWHDGAPVRASDVRFAFLTFTDPAVPSAAGAALARVVDSISVADSATLTVWYRARSAEQFHSVVYNLVPLPQHLLGGIPRDSLRTSSFATSPVGNGPFRFVSWEKGVRFELAAFDDFARGRPKVARLIFTISKDAAAAARAVLAGDADFVEQMSLDDLAEASRQPDVRIIPVRGYDYGFAAFNLRTPDGRAPHPLFGDRNLRRALTMAADRRAMVRNVHDSLARPAIGPFSHAQWSADTTLESIPYDRAGAERALDSLGWRMGADGTRARGGARLAFTLTVSASNKARVRYAELLQQALGAVGAKVAIDLIDNRAFADRLGTHKFDMALFSWRATPSPSGVRQTWGSGAYRPASPFNAGGYRSAAFDAHVDSGLSARDVASARAHLRVAYQTAIDDAPAIWLYDPFVVAAASRRLVIGELRPDAWWQSVASWDVTGPARTRNTTGPEAKP